jgi:hypothetical protein
MNLKTLWQRTTNLLELNSVALLRLVLVVDCLYLHLNYATSVFSLPLDHRPSSSILYQPTTFSPQSYQHPLFQSAPSF